MKLEELGRRAVACPRWRWLPGMAVLRYAPGTPSHGQRKARVDDEFVTYEQALSVHIVPDLSDPATLGCLLALVRAAYRNDKLWAFQVEDARGKWSVTIRDAPQKWFYGSTEAEALVAALEDAP